MSADGRGAPPPGARPPRLARGLVHAVTHADDRDLVLADLHERFAEIASTRGLRAARRWYRRQALSAVAWALVPDLELLRKRSWSGLLGDVRSGLRTLRRSPLYALGVAGTLGVGVTAATLVAALAWTIWLAPMPYPDPGHVVRLYERAPVEAGPTTARRHQFSAPLLEDLREHRFRTIEGVSAVLWGPMNVPVDGRRIQLRRMTLSSNGFGLLGIVPTLGRTPTATESEILVSERFWRDRLGADPDVVGTTWQGGPLPMTIVGVAKLPAGFPGDIDVVNVITWNEERDRDDLRRLRFIDAIARVAPDHTVSEADAELDAFLSAEAEAHPVHRGWGVDAVVLSDDLVGPFRETLALLLAAGAVFLLIAGVNVLGIVASRRVASRRDRAVRLALGASEARLLRGALVESLVLAGVGAGAGAGAAMWLVGPARAQVPQNVPRLADVAVTWPFLAGAVGVGLAMGATIGVLAYLASRGAGAMPGRGPLRGVGGRALVVGQIALTTLLAAAAAAILHRATTLRAIDLGFDPDGVSVMVLTQGDGAGAPLPWSETRAVVEGLQARGIPAAAAFNTPMSGEDQDLPPFDVDAPGTSERIFYQLQPVSPGYFEAMGVDLVSGHSIAWTDDASAANVAVVSEDFVARYFGEGTPPQDVLGTTIQPVMLLRGGATIVGVAAATRHHGPDAPVVPSIYIAYAQQHALQISDLVVRRPPEGAARALTTVTAQVGPGIHASTPIPYSTHLRRWFAPIRLQIVTIGVLAGLGLLLAFLGLYALMAWQVASRRRELGIRKAVGATDARLVRGVVGAGFVMGALGAALGLAAWYELLPWSRTLVAGIDAAGALVPLSVAAVVGVSCLVATLSPALRATRVDPVVTLKAD